MKTLQIKDTFDDLVFENRNKEYGAYYLRRVGDAYTSKAMAISYLFIMSIIFGPQIYAKYKGLKQIEPESHTTVVNIADYLPEVPKKEEPPKLEKKVVPPAKDVIKYIDPTVAIDKDVTEEELPPPIDQLDGKIIGSMNVKGEENGIDPPLINPTEPSNGEASNGNAKPKEEVKEDNTIYSFTAVKPEFPDGLNALMKYLARNIKYPAIAREAGIQGRVTARFVVGKDGMIKDITILRGIGGGCDEEALRVIKSMPNWTPGQNNGKPVNVVFTLPINFTLEN
jgi:periplasmic protein TonB